tara:strand:+ start:113 stop:424 length:312 start_codon:yes stop_codon:yes gene_type:complete
MIVWKDQAPVGTKRGNSKGHNPVSFAVYRVWKTRKKGWCAMRGFKRGTDKYHHKVEIVHQAGPFPTKEEAIAIIEVYDMLVGDVKAPQAEGQARLLTPDKAGY